MRKFREFSAGALVWREFRRPKEMPEFHRLACKVSRKTYQKKKFDAGMDERQSFREELAQEAAGDRVRGYVLFDRGTPIAFNFCRAIGDVLNGELMGFDPAYRRHSPGRVLL